MKKYRLKYIIILTGVLACVVIGVSIYLAKKQIEKEDIIEKNRTERTEISTSVPEYKNLAGNKQSFISNKTSVSKEELNRSKCFFDYDHSIYEKEDQAFLDSVSEDYFSEVIYGAVRIDEENEPCIPDKMISFEEFNQIGIDNICGDRLVVSFFSTITDQLAYEHQIGILIYDIKNEEVLLTILPEDCNYSVINSVLSENYLYWCEAVPYDAYFADTWSIMGMNLNTHNIFTICKSEDFVNSSDFANMGSCYHDSLYFYFNNSQEVTKEYPDLEIPSVTDTAYGFDLMCYEPEENFLYKKAEFNFGYNPYARPCITGDYVYTVDYDGNNWYLLSYHIPTDTYYRYSINLNYQSEYIQDICPSSDYVIYMTNFSRCFLLDLNTLEVREFANWLGWEGIMNNKLYFIKNGHVYCYNIPENTCYKLLEEENYGYYLISCNDGVCAISNSNGKIYLFY